MVLHTSSGTAGSTRHLPGAQIEILPRWLGRRPTGNGSGIASTTWWGHPAGIKHGPRWHPGYYTSGLPEMMPCIPQRQVAEIR